MPVLEADEATRWTGPTVSGGPDSLVPWDTLGREGRRHALPPVRPQPVADRPPGMPDLSIETVMGEPARGHPGAGLRRAWTAPPTARERVDLALAEMERTGAFDRSLIMLVSPTGTGYVNYVAVAAAQYLSRGDIATVTMQYSKRPSPLSLGKVKDAREQNRLLWLRILERLRRPPGPRPRVVLFGESLGAHTSQDVFLHWGTLGLRGAGHRPGTVDRHAVRQRVDARGHRRRTGSTSTGTASPSSTTSPSSRSSASERGRRLRVRPAQPRQRRRHQVRPRPAGDRARRGSAADRPRPEQVEAASPRGIPPAMRWRPITTFFQTLVDMKNAQIPGAYRAWAPRLPPRPAPVRQRGLRPAAPARSSWPRIEDALEQRETAREQLFEPPPEVSGG